jgi:hypothetical protein
MATWNSCREPGANPNEQNISDNALTPHRIDHIRLCRMEEMMNIFQKRFLSALLMLAAIGPAQAVVKNGFDLANSMVPAGQIMQGGPPKDGIPAIDQPKFIKAKEVSFFKGSERVLGVARNGVAKAYPVRILNWHEIVNDKFGDERIAVTFCPLCGTGMAYLSQAAGKQLSFGVSGLLYNSDVLLFDRQTNSLWSQILSKAINGPLMGTRLETIPISHTTWADWKKRHPDTLMLSTDTGFDRDYGRDPYAGYTENPKILFPVSGQSTRYHPKEQVIGVEVNGKFKAYPFVELGKTEGTVSDTIAGKKISVRFDPEHRTGTVYDAAGKEMPSVIAFWFAWFAFHAETEVFQVK